MKVSTFPPLFLLLLIISLSGSCRLGTHAAADHHGHELEDLMVVATSSLEHTARDAAVCSGHKVMPSGDGVRWVPMNRPHGPCSSSPAVMEEDTIDDMLKWDQLRTSYIRRKLSGGGGGAGEDVNSDTTTSGVSEKNGMGVTAVNLGDAKCAAPAPTQSLEEASMTVVMPAARQTMVIDTSSDITWVQCLPCPFPQCHTQKDPFYDPAQSTTYAAIPCGSPACTRLGTAYGNGCSASNNQCRYAVDYGDGTATAGTYITDTLTLSAAIVVEHFQFGCSHAVKGSFSDQTAGVLALGGGAQSLLAQTAKDFGNAFSYCVPLPSSLGFLSLGGPVGASSRFARTPLIRNKRAPTFYIVRLEAITVAGKRLRVPPAAFEAGAVMDSSAVVTQLPPPAYAALRAAFRTAMAAYGPLASPVRNLDTCYDFTRFTNNVTLPKVSLVFAGGAAVLDLDAPSLMLDGCLAFAPTPGGGAHGSSVGFIGNVQQQTYEVLYDVGGGSVGFRRAAC
uniref:Uncharacterized protein n=1 Tax=Avena sativa TaxID=4498 RepID=A0ACD5XWP6_AVESA